MNLLISLHSDIPIYEQIKKQIKKAIIHKQLNKDEQLPGIRTLAKELQVGIVTVKRAYDDLVQEGYLYSKSAKGYYVSNIDISSVETEYLEQVKQHIQAIIVLQDEGEIDNQAIEFLWKDKRRT